MTGYQWAPPLESTSGGGLKLSTFRITIRSESESGPRLPPGDRTPGPRRRAAVHRPAAAAGRPALLHLRRHTVLAGTRVVVTVRCPARPHPPPVPPSGSGEPGLSRQGRVALGPGARHRDRRTAGT
eukprot:749942-Hanusia_phi.AAC.1